MTQDQERELLPCPFCGGEAELDTRQGYSQWPPNGKIGTRVIVYCRDCGADIGVCREDVPEIEAEQIIEMWNRRAALAAPQVQPPRMNDETVLSEFARQGWNGVVMRTCFVSGVRFAEKFHAASSVAPPSQVQPTGDLRGAIVQARDALAQVTTSETFHRDPRGDRAGPVIDAIDAAMAAPVAPAQPGDEAWTKELERLALAYGDECGMLILEKDSGCTGPHPSDRKRAWGQFVSHLRQRPAVAPAQPGWKPIETAPKDGSHVLLYAPELQFVGFYAVAGWCYVAPRVPLAPTQPTHWMPLAAAPASSFQPTVDSGEAKEKKDA